MGNRLRCAAWRWMILVIITLVSALPAAAQPLEERVVEHTLKNGMKFLFVERRVAPIFTGEIVFRAGGVDEQVGATGLAHMLEHMAFKGTRAIGTRNYRKEKPLLDAMDRVAKDLARERARGSAADEKRIEALEREMKRLQEQASEYSDGEEFSAIYTRNGGAGLNAGTSKDITAYHVSLPSNRLELWALMESQRMAEPVLREFYVERDVVAEERRRTYDSSPDRKLYEQLVATAYTAHPYGVPIIGWMSDIQSLTADQARAFHKTYYVPGNAVAALVGDIDIPQAIRVVEKYFGGIPAGPPPPPVVTVEPPQAGERRVNVVFDAEPQVMIAYHKPTAPHPDDTAFDVLHGLLAGGRTSRLYTSLVKEKRIAAGVGGLGGPGSRYANLWGVQAYPLAPHTTGEVEQAIYAEFERLMREPVPERELQKVKNQLDADFVRGLSSNRGLASQLTYYEAVVGDWRYLTRWREMIAQITPEDLQRVARKYLVPENRTVATLVRKESAGQ